MVSIAAGQLLVGETRCDWNQSQRVEFFQLRENCRSHCCEDCECMCGIEEGMCRGVRRVRLRLQEVARG